MRQWYNLPLSFNSSMKAAKDKRRGGDGDSVGMTIFMSGFYRKRTLTMTQFETGISARLPVRPVLSGGYLGVTANVALHKVTHGLNLSRLSWAQAAYLKLSSNTLRLKHNGLPTCGSYKVARGSNSKSQILTKLRPARLNNPGSYISTSC